MAYYAALVQVVQLLEEIIHPYSEYPNSILEKQQLHASLYSKFDFVVELLQGYSPKDKEAADNLERRIRDAAYLTQDIIESYGSKQTLADYAEIPVRDVEILARKKPRGVKRIFRCLTSAFRKPPPQPQPQPQRFKEPMLDDIAEREYHQKLEKVKEDVDYIVNVLVRIKESNAAHKGMQPTSFICAEPSNTQAQSGRINMVGFDENITAIKGQLYGESKLEVISIVGMGGLGKTTLAQNVFHDKFVEDRFDCCVWVTVSQNYQLHSILQAIRDSLMNLDKRESSEAENGVIVEHIYKYLKGRRYLIVMDDVWETKVWDEVKRVFPDDNNGSRIIITTRLLEVAAYASQFVHQLQFLNEDQSWNLFCQKVSCPKELVDVGRYIATSCRGLPLAIVVVAGLLSKVSTIRADWEHIARNVGSTAIVENDEHFSKILALSYDHLPHHLKPCFLYLGGFPEDYEISVSKLIKLWVAEGILKPTASKSLEEVGEEYLNDLVNRNLVLINKKAFNGKVKRCSIHDLLRESCLRRARREKFLYCINKMNYFDPELVENIRRLYIHTWEDFSSWECPGVYVPNVGSILFFPVVWGEQHYISVASYFKRLRVLDSPTVLTSLFPNSMVELLNLRFLAFSGSGYGINVPPSIFKLRNLQTLIIFDRKVSLPSEIWKMTQLRHIMILEMKLAPVPDGEGVSARVAPLERLQTLKRVKNFNFSRNTVEMIPNVRKLNILITDWETGYGNWLKYSLYNLVHLGQIESLGIEFSTSGGLYALQGNYPFPSNLVKLSLQGLNIIWGRMTLVGSLPNLQVLKLKNDYFPGAAWEPIEGEFIKLKLLEMHSLNLNSWQAEDVHFPSLKQLHIANCEYLEEIPSGIGDISSLQLIKVYQCNSSLESSAFRIQEEQQDLGNEQLQVRVVPLQNSGDST